jgi:hypothetical protein
MSRKRNSTIMEIFLTLLLIVLAVVFLLGIFLLLFGVSTFFWAGIFYLLWNFVFVPIGGFTAVTFFWQSIIIGFVITVILGIFNRDRFNSGKREYIQGYIQGRHGVNLPKNDSSGSRRIRSRSY